MEVCVEYGPDGFGKDVPDRAPEQLGAGPLLESLRLGVHVREAPITVERVEGVGHAFQGASQPRVGLAGPHRPS